jgi:hypothetical protein
MVVETGVVDGREDTVVASEDRLADDVERATVVDGAGNRRAPAQAEDSEVRDIDRERRPEGQGVIGDDRALPADRGVIDCWPTIEGQRAAFHHDRPGTAAVRAGDCKSADHSGWRIAGIEQTLPRDVVQRAADWLGDAGHRATDDGSQAEDAKVGEAGAIECAAGVVQHIPQREAAARAADPFKIGDIVATEQQQTAGINDGAGIGERAKNVHGAGRNVQRPGRNAQCIVDRESAVGHKCRCRVGKRDPVHRHAWYRHDIGAESADQRIVTRARNNGWRPVRRNGPCAGRARFPGNRRHHRCLVLSGRNDWR